MHLPTVFRPREADRGWNTNRQLSHLTGAGVFEVARCDCFSSDLGRSDRVPVGRWKRHCIRRNRSQCRPCQNSAGRMVPLVLSGKPDEREGALLQEMILKGVENARFFTRKERSPKSPTAPESSISKIQ